MSHKQLNVKGLI